MNVQKKVHVGISMMVDPGMDEAIEFYGFEDRHHFFRQCIRAIVKAYRNNEKTIWPVEFKAYEK